MEREHFSWTFHHSHVFFAALRIVYCWTKIVIFTWWGMWKFGNTISVVCCVNGKISKQYQSSHVISYLCFTSYLTSHLMYINAKDLMNSFFSNDTNSTKFCWFKIWQCNPTTPTIVVERHWHSRSNLVRKDNKIEMIQLRLWLKHEWTRSSRMQMQSIPLVSNCHQLNSWSPWRFTSVDAQNTWHLQPYIINAKIHDKRNKFCSRFKAKRLCDGMATDPKEFESAPTAPDRNAS